MHTPVCNDSLKWWPEAAPTDIAVATLPATGAVTNPIRLPGAGPWLGIWGASFSGLRVGYGGNGQTYPVLSGSVFPYPVMPDGRNIDLYLSQSGGAGSFSIARFQSREAAISWAGAGGGGGVVSASNPNRSLTADEVVPGGLTKTHVWNAGATYTTFLFATVRADPGNTNRILIGPSIANSLFPLFPGEAENFFVGGSIEFGFTGFTAGDTLHVIEYGIL